MTSFKLRILTSTILILSTLTSCRVTFDDKPIDSTENQAVEYTVNQIKRINPAITNPYDKSTFKQNEFTVTPDDRLLMLMTTLVDHMNEVVITKDTPVTFLVTPVITTDVKRENISLCPIQRNWMMGATWSYAHIFDKVEGQWGTPGGDIGTCMVPTKPKDDAKEIIFDVTDWFVYVVKSKSQNFGLLLKTPETIAIQGDLSVHSPRFKWTIVK